MTLIGYNYPTDTAHPIEGGGWLFILRGFSTLPQLEAAERALDRAGFEGKFGLEKFKVESVDDEAPVKNKMASPPKRAPGRPKKEDSVAKKQKL